MKVAVAVFLLLVAAPPRAVGPPHPTPTGSGTITGNVTWKYNEYVGTKADVGAQVYLFRRSSKSRCLRVVDVRFGESDPAKGFYVTQVDLNGKYCFRRLPPGTYDLLVVSKATSRDLTVALPSDEDPDSLTNAAYRLRDDDPAESGRLASKSTELIYWQMFRDGVLLWHFSCQDQDAPRVVLLMDRKYEAFGNLKLAPGAEIERHVDFGTTYL